MKLKFLKSFLPYISILLMILLFSILAREVIENETYRLDLGINTLIAELRIPFWTSVMKVVSDIGMIGGVFIVGFICANLFFHKKFHVLIGLSITSMGAGLFTYFLKLIIARNRPELISRLVLESGFSFPSGHATTAFVAFPVLALVISSNSKIPTILRCLLILILGVFPFIVAFSRIYLGVHYLTDVIAGAIIGLSATYMFYYFYSKYENG